jgi:hypothetical protein
MMDWTADIKRASWIKYLVAAETLRRLYVASTRRP